jgi:hypothetical protein
MPAEEQMPADGGMEDNIRNYNYSGRDLSMLSSMYNKMGIALLVLIRDSVSPNVITIAGASGVAVSFALVLLFKRNIPHPALCIICFFLLFFYQMMDILDGQQAKRVGMYHNPTTELFDHGFDSLTTMLVLYNLLSLAAVLESNYKLSLLIFVLAFSNFYLSTWEHTVTGVMTFKNIVSSPTDTIVITKLLFIVLAFYPGLFHNRFIVILSISLVTVASVINFFDIAIRRIAKWNVLIIPLFLPWLQLLVANTYALPLTIPLLVLPMLIAILTLIWVEITKVRYNLPLLLVVYAIGLLAPVWGTLLSGFVYAGLFIAYTSKMCRVLSMKHFYSIPS